MVERWRVELCEGVRVYELGVPGKGGEVQVGGLGDIRFAKRMNDGRGFR